jgi:BlaI family penicillinase repressor
MGDINISDAEWRVMQVVWRRGRATAAEVIDALADAAGWRHRTVRTLLARLVDKGALAVEPDGNRYVYHPLVSRGKCVRDEGRSFLNKVFSGDTAELLVHFARDAKMSPEQIAELKRLLDDKTNRRRTP